MQNVEYKAELRDPELARGILRRLGATLIGTVRQQDTYYRLPAGKLKKREVAGESTEFIFYEREQRVQPKLSTFAIYSEAYAQERFGASPMPVWVVVRKVRELHVLSSVRVHLDDVEGLGRFLELEAMVSVSQSVAACRSAVESLRTALGPALGEPLACGYAELLAGREEGGTTG